MGHLNVYAGWWIILNCSISVFAIGIVVSFTILLMKTSNVKIHRKLLIITFICLCSFASGCIIDVLTVYCNLIYCSDGTKKGIYYLWYSLWIVGKLTQYLIYIFQMINTFKGSVFAYSIKVYIGLFILWIFQAINVTGSMMFSGGTFFNANKQIFIFETLLLIIDAILIIIINQLFLHPMLKIMRFLRGDDNEPNTVRQASEAESLNTNSSTSISGTPQSKIVKKPNKKHQKLLYTSTKLLLLSTTALSTSFIWQLLWVIAIGINHEYMALSEFTFSLGIATTINMICITLTYSFTNHVYRRVCIKCLRLHHCCTRLISTVHNL